MFTANTSRDGRRDAVAVLDQPHDRPAKTMGASRCTLSRVIFRSNENIFGSGKGTLILELVDDVAWATAARHCDGHAMTVAVDQMTFREPVWPGDVVSASAQVEGTGQTSMSIGVYVTALRRGSAAPDPVAVAEAHLRFVAVDDAGRPRPVPGVRPETEQEYREHRAAAVRKKHCEQMARALADLAARGPA